MDLEMKAVPVELENFKPGEVAKLQYDTKQVVAFIKDSNNKAEALDLLAKPSYYAAADIMVRCAICEEHVSMNSNDYRAQGVFICDKCKAAVLHVRELLENGRLD